MVFYRIFIIVFWLFKEKSQKSQKSQKSGLKTAFPKYTNIDIHKRN